ncbi:hypothetical protein [Mycolicibacterium canariasense]|uniref:hypothetical protein n=1 Tax=Mycolicibacterium canariasense TaxID=228230 RepID=UPI0032D5A178
MMQAAELSFSQSRYNALPSVELAAELLAGHQSFDDFLSAFANLAYAHGVEELVGAFLLHRHFWAPGGYWPLETFSASTDPEEPSLITEMAKVTGGQGFEATRWRVIFREGSVALDPLEASDDPGVPTDSDSIPEASSKTRLPVAESTESCGIAVLSHG